jgi:hypothetical protein
MTEDVLFELPARRSRGYGYRQVIKGVRFRAWHPQLPMDEQVCRTWTGLARRMAHLREVCKVQGLRADALHFRASDDGQTWRMPTVDELVQFVVARRGGA